MHGDGGLDELSPYGINLVVEILDGDVREWELDPRELGIYPTDPTELRGGSAAENAATIRSVLAGEKSGRRDAVLLNAAGALVAAGLADDLGEGLELGAAAIDSGTASSRLDALVAFSRRRRSDGALQRRARRRPASGRSPRSSAARPRQATYGPMPTRP